MGDIKATVSWKILMIPEWQILKTSRSSLCNLQAVWTAEKSTFPRNRYFLCNPLSSFLSLVSLLYFLSLVILLYFELCKFHLLPGPRKFTLFPGLCRLYFLPEPSKFHLHPESYEPLEWNIYIQRGKSYAAQGSKIKMVDKVGIIPNFPNIQFSSWEKQTKPICLNTEANKTIIWDPWR